MRSVALRPHARAARESRPASQLEDSHETRTRCLAQDAQPRALERAQPGAARQEVQCPRTVGQEVPAIAKVLDQDDTTLWGEHAAELAQEGGPHVGAPDLVRCEHCLLYTSPRPRDS